jgi:hypothetical protein
MILLSCKKDHSKAIVPTLSLHKITFNVGFSQTTANFASNSLRTNSLSTNSVDTALTNHVNTIYYAVYDSLGNNVHTIKQLSTDNNFGSYTDNLHSGKYTIVIGAGGTGLFLGEDVQNTSITSSKLNTDILWYGLDNSSDAFIKDAFYKKIAITVTNSDASQSVTLDRITSKLTINIEDALPANAGYIEATFITAPAFKFYVGSAIPFDNAINISVLDTIASSAIGTTNNKLSAILLFPTSPISVDLACRSSGNLQPLAEPIIAEKVIPNVTCPPNTQAILTGKLFGGTGTTSTGGFKITIDTSWNSTPITKSFP